MSKTDLQFDESTKSKLWDLYKINNDKMEGPTLTINQKELTPNQLVKSLVEVPGISTYPFALTPNYKFESIEKTIFNLPCSTKRGLIRFTKVQDFKNVKYINSCIKGGKFYKPRMKIEVGTVEPNSKVRINTGYILTFPPSCRIPYIEHNEIKEGTLIEKQMQFIVIPMIQNKGGDEIIPNINVRDADDRGMLCLTLYTRTGNVGTLLVTFQAFECAALGGTITSIDLEGKTNKPIKPKDIVPSRNVYNLKIAYDFANGIKKPDGLYFDALDKKTNLVIKPAKVIFSSRKREWCTDRFTTSGYYDGETFISPTVVELPSLKSKDVTNLYKTHCVSVIVSRIVLFDEPQTSRDNFTYVNGYFFDMENYKEIIKSLRQMIRSMRNLDCGFHLAKDMGIQPIEKVMTIYDYNLIMKNEEEIKREINLSEEDIFKLKVGQGKAYSQALYRSLVRLAPLSKLFTIEELKTLPTFKRKQNEATNSEELKAKMPKL